MDIKKENRNFNRSIHFRVDEDLHNKLKELAKKSGLTQQGVLLRMLTEQPLPDQKSIDQLKEIEQDIRQYLTNLKITTNNINQISMKLNAGDTYTEEAITDELVDLYDKLQEGTELWAYLKSSIQAQAGRGA